MTNYRRRLDLARKTLCLSCCKPMEHGYCQACWERESQRKREARPEQWEQCGIRTPSGEVLHLEQSTTVVRRYCRACGQWRELTAGQCECGTEKR